MLRNDPDHFICIQRFNVCSRPTSKQKKKFQHCDSSYVFCMEVHKEYLHVHYIAFFAVFPDHCYSFFGPYDQECLSSVWIDSGCTMDGFFYLKDTLPGKYQLLHDMNLGLVVVSCVFTPSSR